MTNAQKARHVKTSVLLITILMIASGLTCWLFTHPVSFIIVLGSVVISLVLALVYTLIFNEVFNYREDSKTMEEDHY